MRPDSRASQVRENMGEPGTPEDPPIAGILPISAGRSRVPHTGYHAPVRSFKRSFLGVATMIEMGGDGRSLAGW